MLLWNTLVSNIGTQWQFLLVLLVAGAGVGFLLRWGTNKLFAGSVRGIKQNIETSGRLLRAITGMILLLWALLTDMHPWLLFFAGFCFFQAWFSRCGFYAAIGKSSCPIE